MMAEGAEIQMAMFEAVQRLAAKVPEIELVAAAEAVGEFCRFWWQCKCADSLFNMIELLLLDGLVEFLFFDSAIGGTGPHPMASMGSGFSKIRANEPVLVD